MAPMSPTEIQSAGPATAEHTERLPAQPVVSDRVRRQSVDLRGAPAGRYLLIEDEDDSRLLPLEAGVLRIGRSLNADLRLEDQTVSRRHAIVVQRPGGHRVLDDRSANGILVNGVRVEQADLSDGDVIVVGRIALRYLVLGPAGA